MSHSHSLAGAPWTISELAEEFGVTARAIRFYEHEGLLAPQRIGQQRLYHRGQRARLKLILRGKRLGMRLAEIKELFELYELFQGEERQLERYLALLKEKRQMLLRRRQDVDDALAELEESERRCRALLERKQAALRARQSAPLDA